MKIFTKTAASLLTLISGAVAIPSSSSPSSTASAATSTPTQVQLNLVFPLNGTTYAPPEGPMPIVFALTHSSAGESLAPFIQYYIYDVNNSSRLFGSGDIKLRDVNSDGADTDGMYYLFNYTTKLAGLEGTFVLHAIMGFTQCVSAAPVSEGGDGNFHVIADYSDEFKDTFFTLQKGASMAAVVNSTSGCRANDTTSHSFNVTSIVQLSAAVQQADHYDGATCPFVNNMVPYYDPPACAPTVGADAAASISAVVQADIVASAAASSSAPAATSASAGPAAFSGSSLSLLAVAWGACTFSISFVLAL